MSLWILEAQEYTVAEGDVIRIEVYDNPELTTIVRISADGSIIVPLIGKINVKNLSTDQISDKISTHLADGYLINPQVNVFINEYRGQSALILGQVNNPGTYELLGSITFLELISRAGGLTEIAGDKATIKRTFGKQSGQPIEIIEVDLRVLLEKGDKSQNINILDKDSITIGRAGQYYVTGEVRNPASFRYDIGDYPNVIKAITLAGGFTENADQDDILIYRTVNGQKRTLTSVKLDTIIQVHDVVLVPNVFIADFKGQKANILGQINNPGYYELRGPTTLLEFISRAGGLTDDAGDVVTIKRIDEKSKSRTPIIISVDLNALIEKGDMTKNVDILQGDSVYINRMGRYYVNGQVNRPDAYEYRKGADITLIKAITLAGGFTGSADEDNVKIIRMVKGKERIIEDLRLSEPILENDVIIIPESFF